MQTTSETWVVTIRVNGESHVYATADNRSHARRQASELRATCPELVPDVMTWDDAARLGMVEA